MVSFGLVKSLPLFVSVHPTFGFVVSGIYLYFTFLLFLLSCLIYKQTRQVFLFFFVLHIYNLIINSEMQVQDEDEAEPMKLGSAEDEFFFYIQMS
ncbi:hypothetical protein BC941DRAFT_230292 [Chlamydoabsidia padenii]|nr:hypothetical protein BC941DRAFT_230292 [Chlamydoabsidia padenii]